MRFASSHTIFAWSFLVAAAYISAPASPSAIIRYRAIADASVLFPFFLATISSTSWNRLNPVSTSIKPNAAATNARCHSSSTTGLPPQRPLLCLQYLSINVIA